MKIFKDWVSESFQYGRNKAPRTKQEEIQIANQSPIYKEVNYKGWRIKPTIHSAAQAYDRRPDMEFSDWEKLHKRIVDKLESGKPRSGDYIFFSRSMQQGYVAAVDFSRKGFRIITVLPKGRKNPKPGTELMMVEMKTINAIFVEVD